jgi:hypothetical protein
LEKINKEHQGFLRKEDVIKYGSDPNNQFNYICPRYWCLKNNTIVDPKDLKEVIDKNGKKELQHPTCGKVLDENDKVVKPGYYIYEFYKDKYVKATKNTVNEGDKVEALDNDIWLKGIINKIIQINNEKKYNYEIKTNDNKTIVTTIDNIRHKYKRYPDFQVDKHPDGYCLPCCFAKYNTVVRIKAK